MTKEVNNNKEIAIEVKNLSKHFRLPIEKSSSIKQSFINLTKGIKGYKEQKVLRNISFNVEKGDFFGIVGRNGSGKSTLLKLISGIYQPDNGSVEINGSLVSFIELGVGFNPELTGRENVYLNGALMGFDNKAIDAMYDEIVEFAELEEFMDQKLKNYSSGMQVRLSFSCAIRAKSDILVLDEILAVGDEAFQRKCNEYFDKIKQDKNQTVVLVTHDMGSVKKYCNKAMMIQDGRIVVYGSPDDAANEYSLENLESSDNSSKKEKSKKEPESIVKNFKVELMSKKQVSQDDKVKVKISYTLVKPTKLYAVVDLLNADSNVCMYAASSRNVSPEVGKKIEQVVTFDIHELCDSQIKVMATLYNTKREPLVFLTDKNALRFIIRRTDNAKKTNALLVKRGVWLDNDNR